MKNFLMDSVESTGALSWWKNQPFSHQNSGHFSHTGSYQCHGTIRVLTHYFKKVSPAHFL
jgi:hypothetical protein